MQRGEAEETTELQTQQERAAAVQLPPRPPSRARAASSPSRGDRRSSALLPPGSALLPARRRQDLPSSALGPQLFPSPGSELSGSFPPLASLVFSQLLSFIPSHPVFSIFFLVRIFLDLR